MTTCNPSQLRKMLDNRGLNSQSRPSYSCGISRNFLSCFISIQCDQCAPNPYCAAHVQRFTLPGTTQQGFEATRFAAMTSWKRHNHTIRGAKEVPGVGRLDIETFTSIPRTQSRRHLRPVPSTFVGPLTRKCASLLLILLNQHTVNF